MLITFRMQDGSTKKLRTKFELTGQTLTIGRGSDADVQIEDEKCSRINSALRAWEEMIIIRDMNSSNGTFVNEERTRLAELHPGDVVRMGSTHFSFETEGNKNDLTLVQDQDE